MADEPAGARRSIEHIAEAVAQARREERINARLDNHEVEIRELRQGLAATTHALTELKTQLTRLETAAIKAAAVAEAMAEAAASATAAMAERANRALTQRGLVVTAGLLFVALAGLILGVNGKV